MSTVYDVKTDERSSKDKNSQLASVAYVDEIAKAIIDALIAHANNVDNAHSPDFSGMLQSIQTPKVSVKDLDIGLAELPEIDAKDIKTDSTHQFLTDTLISIFKSKPSKIDLNIALDDIRNELKATINDSYIKLINTPDALQKLRDISYLLQEDTNLQTLLNALASKATAEELVAHMKSNYHLNSNDRKALNLLLGFIKEGCADWEATEDAPNFIRNKPTSLPANGGNCNTIDGYTSEDVLTRRYEDYIIGIEGNDYKESSVDGFISKDYSNINEIFAMMPTGKVYIRKGVYLLKNLMFSASQYDDRTIIGCGNGTILNARILILDSYTNMEDLLIKDSNVRIRGNCRLHNVTFSNCKIIMDNSLYSVIKNCVFDDYCTFEWLGSCMNNLIAENRVLASLDNLYYIGGNNIIKDNFGA